jgi:hypothetical protein
MTSQWPLQLHSDFCDQFILFVIENDSNYFFDRSKNP